MDLRAVAAQLPDLSNLDNLTVNLQANTFLTPPDNSNQIHALAHETHNQLGLLRCELQHTLEQGNVTITERFTKLGRWC
jgi:hypothetical protein